MTTRLLTALTAAALLATPAAPASAQGAAPAPGCFGVQITDKAGDSANALEASQTGSPSSDLIAGWITYDAAAGKGFAHIQVDNLTEGEVDAPYVAIGWEMTMSTADGDRYVRAYHDRAGITKYSWASPSDPTDPTAERVGGETTGTLFPGKGGVIQIELPAEMGAKPGTQLKGLGMEVRQWASLPAAVPSTGLPLVYPAPIYDDATGKGSVTLGPCPAAPAAGAPGGPAAPAPVAGPAPQQAAFDVKVTVPKLSARKLAKAKKFRVKLSGNATSLTAAVRRRATGGKRLASGRLAALKGSGKLTLKGKLKKGTYVLLLSGRNASGQATQGAVKFKVGR